MFLAVVREQKSVSGCESQRRVHEAAVELDQARLLEFGRGERKRLGRHVFAEDEEPDQARVSNVDVWPPEVERHRVEIRDGPERRRNLVLGQPAGLEP